MVTDKVCVCIGHCTVVGLQYGTCFYLALRLEFGGGF
jgi:hypothetical protein